ncbi:MAG: hypothetical protein GKR89_04780 [Candidatus Latescibacteria bacterium]|nr:hypothetical protein [Candidatus Latescibacterota bacterium]
MEYLALWLICGAFGGAIANARTGAGGKGFVLGLLLGPLGLILAFFVGARSCPHCHGKVHNNARVCRHCGRDIPRPKQTISRKSMVKGGAANISSGAFWHRAILVLFGVVVICGFVLMLFTQLWSIGQAFFSKPSKPNIQQASAPTRQLPFDLNGSGSQNTPAFSLAQGVYTLVASFSNNSPVSIELWGIDENQTYGTLIDTFPKDESITKTFTIEREGAFKFYVRKTEGAWSIRIE